MVVDDEEGMREALEILFKKHGFTVILAETGEKALEKADQNALDAAVVDVKMPGMDGIETLKRLKQLFPQLPVVMITGYATINSAVEAIKQGAFDYITKPFEVTEILNVISNMLKIKNLTEENHNLKQSLQKHYRFETIIGNSPKMQNIFNVLEKVLDNSVTILIGGESGTGKEVVANAIHYNSNRKDKPFISVNCAAIPESLLESELFGYEKGTFTGAVSRHIGMFEQAHKGSIFLDEIGDMSISLQAKLLRVLQDKSFTRLGGDRLIRTDFRIIAATNHNLIDLIHQRRFREDLFYRLNVVPINLPPLRERREDIPLLVNQFIKDFNKVHNRSIQGISSNAIKFIMDYSWPGNVRELKNAIESAVVLSRNPYIELEDLSITVNKLFCQSQYTLVEEGDIRKEACSFQTIESKTSFKETIESFTKQTEREIIVEALLKCKGNRTQAAQQLNISRKTLYNKLHEYSIE